MWPQSIELWGPPPSRWAPGLRVIFAADGAYVENAQGHDISLRRNNGMWYLDCWRVPDDVAEDEEKLAKFVHRQG